eukprot:14696736-Ditylum_brightwellii.AAC.1
MVHRHAMANKRVEKRRGNITPHRCKFGTRQHRIWQLCRRGRTMQHIRIPTWNQRNQQPHQWNKKNRLCIRSIKPSQDNQT